MAGFMSLLVLLHLKVGRENGLFCTLNLTISSNAFRIAAWFFSCGTTQKATIRWNSETQVEVAWNLIVGNDFKWQSFCWGRRPNWDLDEENTAKTVGDEQRGPVQEFPFLFRSKTKMEFDENNDDEAKVPRVQEGSAVCHPKF